jgi:hypothetical protein
MRGKSLLQGWLDGADKAIGLDGDHDQSYRSDAEADTAERAPVWYVKLRLREMHGNSLFISSLQISRNARSTEGPRPK